MKCPFAIMFAAFAIGCSSDKHDIYTLEDVTKAEIIVLHKRAGQGWIHGFHLESSGRIDGEASIALMLEGKPYRTRALSGNVRFSWGGDWYSDSMEIHYAPATVTGGELELKYLFRDH